METQSFTFPSFIRAEFEKKLASLNKKLAKIADANQVQILTENYFDVNIPVPSYVPEAVSHEDMVVEHTTVQVNLPISLTHKGYSYVGSLISDGDTILRWGADGYSLAGHDEMKCDHCGHNRKRKKCFALKEDSTGDIKIIGSTCVNEYLGGLQVEQALNTFFKFYDNITNLDHNSLLFKAGRTSGTHIDLFIGAAIVAHYLFPEYVKTAYRDSSINRIWDVLYGGDDVQIHPNVVLPSVAEIKDRLISKYNVPQANSNFIANIKSALFINGNLKQHITSKGYGIASWVIWDALNNPTAPVNNTRPATNIGEVGDDVEVKGQVVNSEMVYTLNGATPKITIKTDNNQKVVILGGELQSEGEEIEVRGRVQHHTNFKGFKSTWVTVI